MRGLRVAVLPGGALLWAIFRFTGFGKAIRPSDRWTAQLANIVKMRQSRTAAVDSMGCERCADTTAPLPVQRFQTLVSLMLSSQTKDEVTYAAVQRLITGLDGSLTPQAVRAADEETVGKLIYPVGFWRNKARFLKLAAEDCLDKFGGDIPSTLEGLCSLKGVGPKMAFRSDREAMTRRLLQVA